MVETAERYVVLLRGINVGGHCKVEMARLRALLESLGFSEVSTYINSGNVLLASGLGREEVRRRVEEGLRGSFACESPALVKTQREMREIAEAIPGDWRNDTAHRTDVAYLFEEADSERILDDLPLKREHVDVRYTKGAVLWHLDRDKVSQSQLGKLIGHKLYRSMTIRNVNTARALGGLAPGRGGRGAKGE